MKKKKRKQKNNLKLKTHHSKLFRPGGFLLLEASLSIAVIAIALTAFLGGIAQALRIENQSTQTTHAILEFEKLAFDLETGLRSDLALYGGKGPLGEYHYEIDSKENESIQDLTLKVLSKEGKEILRFEESLPRGSFE